MIKSFENVSKEEWFKQIRMDLKGTELESFIWQIGRQIEVDPFLHASDFQKDKAINAKSSELNKWRSALTFPVSKLQPDNSPLLECLNHGLETPIIQVNAVESTDWSLILNDVVLDFIDLHIEVPDATTGSRVSSELENLGHNQFKLAYRELPIDTGFNTSCLLIEEDPTSDTDVALAEILATAYAAASSQDDPFPLKNMVVRLQSSNSFLKEIAKVRAMNILWANLSRERSNEVRQADIQVWINERNFTDDPYQNLYISSTLCLSAIIGGAGTVIIDRPDIHTEKKLNSSYQLALNIHHMLKYESYLDRVVDPAKGSFAIEKLTAEIAKSAWSTFIDNV